MPNSEVNSFILTAPSISGNFKQTWLQLLCPLEFKLLVCLVDMNHKLPQIEIFTFP